MRRTTKRPTPRQACNTVLSYETMRRCKLEATVVLVDYAGLEAWTCEVCALVLMGARVGGGA